MKSLARSIIGAVALIAAYLAIAMIITMAFAIAITGHTPEASWFWRALGIWTTVIVLMLLRAWEDAWKAKRQKASQAQEYRN